MTETEIAEGLKTLGYDPKWIDYGFLDLDELRQQLLIFDTGEDRNTEHYRYAAFCRVLERDALADLDLDHYLELISAEPDAATGESVRHLLIWWPKLTRGQRSRLRAHPDFAEGRHQRQFAIYDLAAELHVSTIPNTLFDRCLATGDETLQRKIVEHPAVTRAQLERLIETGKSKAVRNMASARLRRMDASSAP